MRSNSAGSSDVPISIDVSEVRREDVRVALRASLKQLSHTSLHASNFWSTFPERAQRTTVRTLVVGDLSRIVRRYQSHNFHSWIASVRTSKPYFVALVRTVRDERFADLVDDLVRHSDLRISVCRSMKKADVRNCLAEALSALNPRSIIDVRYSTGADHLWVSFGDGLSGNVNFGALQLTEVVDDLVLESATVGARGATIELLTKKGGLFEIDSESVRALLNAAQADAIAARSRQSDVAVGDRIRESRKAAGLTQAELGIRIEVDQAILSKLERGLHQPRIDTLRRIAAGLGMSLSEMLLGNESG